MSRGGSSATGQRVAELRQKERREKENRYKHASLAFVEHWALLEECQPLLDLLLIYQHHFRDGKI